MSDRTNRHWSEDDLISYIRLHLAVEYPTLEECYVHGYVMAQGGFTEEDNPYQADGDDDQTLASTTHASYWQQGWWDGLYQQAPAFELPEDAKQIYLGDPVGEPDTDQPKTAANDPDYQSNKDHLLATVAKFAAAVAGAILSYQVIDLIA